MDGVLEYLLIMFIDQMFQFNCILFVWYIEEVGICKIYYIFSGVVFFIIFERVYVVYKNLMIFKIFFLDFLYCVINQNYCDCRLGYI